MHGRRSRADDLKIFLRVPLRPLRLGGKTTGKEPNRRGAEDAENTQRQALFE